MSKNNLPGTAFYGKINSDVKILAVSDQPLERVYTLASSGQFNDIELVLGCGDLPHEYLEFLVTVLNVPLFYVPGNHDALEHPRELDSGAQGASNLDLRLARHRRFLFAGFGGSIRYRPDEANQYSQMQAFARLMRMLPRLWLNRVRYGRALDILISHSPPLGINDDDDPAHRGLQALNWLIRTAKPRYHFHGHTHFAKRNLAPSETTIGLTRVINVFPYMTIDVSH